MTGMVPAHPSDDRPPIWRQPERWLRAAAAGTLLKPFHSEALRPEATEPRPVRNHSVLEMGPQRLLHARGSYAADQLGSVGGLVGAPDWPAQRRWLPKVFRAFYGRDEPWLGWYTILTARKPAQFRKDHDPTIVIEQADARPRYLHPEEDPEEYLHVPLDGVRFANPAGTPATSCRMAMTVVPRQVTCHRLGIDEPYEEAWFCRARRGEDDDRLRKGRIPAVPEHHYQDAAVRVRESILMNLVRLTRHMEFQLRCLEFHPGEASVLSIRRSRMPLGAAVLCGVPVDHYGLATILGG